MFCLIFLFFFWLRWVFVAVRRLSVVAMSGVSHCLSCCGEWALGTQTSVVAARGISSCGTWALERVGFSSCGVWALGHVGFSSCGAQAPYLWLVGSRA